MEAKKTFYTMSFQIALIQICSNKFKSYFIWPKTLHYILKLTIFRKYGQTNYEFFK